MGWFLHLRLLVWKNLLLQRRRPVGTLFEILIPTLLFFALVGIRTTITKSSEPPESFCSYPVSLFDYQRPLLNSRSDNGNIVYGTPKSQECNNWLLWTGYIKQNGFTGIGYAPNTTETRDLMGLVESLYNGFSNDFDRANLTFVGFDTETDIEELVDKTLYKYLLGVVFYTDDTYSQLGMAAGNKIYYKLRPRDDATEYGRGWEMGRNFEEFEQLGPADGNRYKYNTGVPEFQNMIDTAFMIRKSANGQSGPQTIMRLKPFPFPAYEDDGFIFAIRIMFPLILILSFLYPVLSMVKAIVLEKEKRLKEALRMMGVSNLVIWVAWFIKSLLFLFISVIIITAAFFAGNVLTYSDNGVVFVFLLLYVSSTIAYSFLLSTFFSKASTAASAAGILFFLGYVPYFFIQNDFESLGSSEKHASCLLSPTCVGIGAQILSRFEAKGVGLKFDNLSSAPSDVDSFSMATVFGMLILDTVLYLVLTWYIENVNPGTYGVPQKPWFFLRPSYWGCCKRERQVADTYKSASDPIPENVEPDPQNLKAGISIQGLKKVYKGAAGTKLAVDGLSLNLFEGQVTALLGHNGAGKTTTMSILVGLFPPTAGTAYINGHDIRTDLTRVRESLGLCPQYDVLWDDLTVQEHCIFFGRLKGLSGRALKAEAAEFIKDLDLEPKRNARSKTLSGGQRRALSVALAFTGGSKVVILDEPTSGMDPYKRRHTWNVLLKHKKNRTVLLTTHFMDEADLLGDRIAIMSSGQLRTVGSSRFLKARFGVGYHLTLVKNPSCSVARLTSAIQSFAPSAHVLSDVGAELTFILRKKESSSFPALFQELESRRAAFGIDSYGISATTMEEVFLRVGHGEAASQQERTTEVERIQSRRSDTKPAVDLEQTVLIPEQKARLATGSALRWQQFRALFIKRYLHSKRHVKTLLAQTLLPVLFVIAALSIAKTGSELGNEPPRELRLDTYEPNNAFGTARNTGGDYWSWANTLGTTILGNDGNRDPTALQTSLLASTNTLFASDPRMSTTTYSSVGTTNFTNFLNVRSADFQSNGFFDEHFVSFTFEQGAFQMLTAPDGSCLFRSGPTFPDDFVPAASLTLVVEHSYAFQLFNKTGSSNLHIEDTSNNFLGQADGVNSADVDAASIITWQVPSSADTETFTLHCQSGGPTTPITVVSNPALETAPNGITAYAWFNEKALHASVEVANVMANIVAQAEVAGDAEIYTVVHPLPRETGDQIDDIQSSVTGFNLALFTLFGTGFLLASFALFLVTERATKAKHLQFVSGAGPATFWFATFAWDLVNVVIPTVLILIVFACFDVPAFRGERLGIVLLMLLLFAWAGLPLTYLLSRRFEVASNAYAKLSMLFIFGSIALLVCVFVMTLVDLEDEAKIVKTVGFIIPNYALAQGFLDMYSNYNYNDLCRESASQLQACKDQGIVPRDNYLDMEQYGVGLNCLMMAMCGMVYFVILLAVELHGARISNRREDMRQYLPSEEDEDVARERERVESGRADDMLVINGVSKVYHPTGRPPFPAVRSLSLGIPKGECFGLLGVNGAGKTTTFKMLTGDHGMSAGTATLCGHDLARELKTVRQHIGYCPQFDALIGQLTGREMLQLYARLRGVSEEDLPELVQALIERLDLVKYADRQCYSYSGGNKRKLSTAVALIGNPPIVFLDEPTTGMDPEARRFLWDVLTEIQQDHCIVFTSHSMEECEALCNRLAIMVNGQFKCIGSPQHLKHRFGKGYSLIVKLRVDDPTGKSDTTRLKQYIESSFRGAELKEEYNGEVTYQVNDDGASWSDLFARMESARQELGIEDYVLSQTSLEQVFLGFAADQNKDSAIKTTRV